MRYQKFRVWWSHVESDCFGFDYFDALDGWCDKDPLQEPIAVEQFTGLLDKNGKEIYEGDIVKLSRSLGYQSQMGDIGDVRFDESELGYHIFKVYAISKLTASRGEYVEIIGNIHENPELLER